VTTYRYRIGADENGLGARLGPLVVTAVLARVDERGARAVGRKLPKTIAEDLDDSKKLVSHGNWELGEAWARAIVGDVAQTPPQLLEALSLEGTARLQTPCPEHVTGQCWSADAERFQAAPEDVTRLRKHLGRLESRGIQVVSVKSSVVCTKLLNDARRAGRNRFVVDLHAMERLVLGFRETAGEDVFAVCGKVGGMADYSRFFGPLSDRLHVVLERRRRRSAYHFPGVGEVHFIQDADGRDALVMLASMVGKYVRELLMTRVFRFYRATEDDPSASGYHDPITTRFMAGAQLIRRKRRIPVDCFERAGDSE
jgi:ribonuclease HII